MQKNIWGLAEKMGLTAVEAYLSVLIMSGAFDADNGQKAWMAAIAAVLTIIANGGIPDVPTGVPFVPNLIGRTLRTFAVGFATALVAVPQFNLDVETLEMAAFGGLTAAIAVAKGLVASRIGANTPALLPAEVDPAT